MGVDLNLPPALNFLRGLTKPRGAMLQDSLPFFDGPEQMQKGVSGDKDAGSSHGDHVKKKKPAFRSQPGHIRISRVCPGINGFQNSQNRPMGNQGCHTLLEGEDELPCYQHWEGVLQKKDPRQHDFLIVNNISIQYILIIVSLPSSPRSSPP